MRRVLGVVYVTKSRAPKLVHSLSTGRRQHSVLVTKGPSTTRRGQVRTWTLGVLPSNSSPKGAAQSRCSIGLMANLREIGVNVGALCDLTDLGFRCSATKNEVPAFRPMLRSADYRSRLSPMLAFALAEQIREQSARPLHIVNSTAPRYRLVIHRPLKDRVSIKESEEFLLCSRVIRPNPAVSHFLLPMSYFPRSRGTFSDY